MNSGEKTWYKYLLFSLIVGLSAAVIIQRTSAERQTFDIEAIFDKQNVYPMVVVGSGPSGSVAALYGAREKVNVIVIKGDLPGGLLMETTEVTNWPGNKTILGSDIIEGITEQVEAAGAHFHDDSVESIDVSEWPYRIQTRDGDTIYALTIIIASGAHPRKLGVPGEKEFRGDVKTCAICDASLPANKGKEALVVGGGDSAVEMAIQSAAHQKTVKMLVRKGELRAAATTQERLRDYPNISVVYNVEVQEIVGQDQQMTGVRVYNNKTEETSVIPAEIVFLAIGHTPNSDFIRNTLTCDDAGYIVTKGKTQETSVEGVFAAGEVADNRYRQAITSAGDGAKAGLDALNFLRDIGFSHAIAQRLEDQQRASVTKEQ